VKTYDVVIWKEEGIWTAHSPSVPGVYGLGSTREIANRDLKEALALLSHYLREIGESLQGSVAPHKSAPRRGAPAGVLPAGVLPAGVLPAGA
jgi:predicted RNase H-like HicB family nuclease